MSAITANGITVQDNRVAAIQMVSGHDIDRNLEEARRLLAQAAGMGARLAVLPENFAVLSTRKMLECGLEESSGHGPIQNFLAEQAAALGLWIVGGSLPISTRPDGSSVPDHVRASCVVFNDQGQQVARYDKIHLFDAMVEDAQGQYRESDTFEPGEDIVVLDTPAGRLGLAICYDLRFPELYRRLVDAGATLVLVPSAWPYPRVEHWQLLPKARAVENLAYVAAVNGVGSFAESELLGRSTVYDPWGTAVASTGDQPDLVTADLNPERVRAVRDEFPALEDRRQP